MRGVSSTNRCGGGEALVDVGEEPSHTDAGSVANVTALEPGKIWEVLVVVIVFVV